MKKLIAALTALFLCLVSLSASAQLIPVGSSLQAVRDSLATIQAADIKEVSEGTISPRVTEIHVPLLKMMNVNWSLGIELRKPDSVTHVLYTAYKVGEEDYKFLEEAITKDNGAPYSDHPTSAVGKVWAVNNKYLIALALDTESKQITLEYRDLDFAKKD